MSEINSWSTTAASNNSSPPDGWPENMSFANVNNSAREMMAALKRWRDDINGSLTSGGSSGAYTLTPNRTISAYASGLEFVWKANHTTASTSSPTLNVSSVGATAIKDYNGDYISVTSGRYYRTVYLSSTWVTMDAFPETGANQSWSKTQYYASNNETSSTLAIDCLAEPDTYWTLSANGTLNDFTNKTKGARGVLTVIQGGSGGYTVSPNSSIKGTWPTLSTSVGAYDEIYWSCPDGSTVSIVGYSLDVLA